MCAAGPVLQPVPRCGGSEEGGVKTSDRPAAQPQQGSVSPVVMMLASPVLRQVGRPVCIITLLSTQYFNDMEAFPGAFRYEAFPLILKYTFFLSYLNFQLLI